MPIGAQSGFSVAFQEFVYFAGPIIQMLYWVVVAVAAVYAVLLFKRLVECKTGAAQAASEPVVPAAGDPVRVEEFVE